MTNHDRYGPNGEHVAALIDQARRMTPKEWKRFVSTRDTAWATARDAAWDAAYDAVWATARGTAWDTAWAAAWAASWATARATTWDAAWDAAWSTAWDTTLALIVRDLITTDQYRTLVSPWASVMGWPHPDDEETP